jgi:hypothetical protein
MASTSTSCVNPSSLSLPSPHSNESSPAPESSDNHSPGPSRKRQRSDVSSEERKEARAHRNRIAAQNSRDRRKAQFSYLERRVAELEEENRQLRAGLGMANLRRSEESKSEAQLREKARDKENEELKERIKSLEKGWDAVVKALSAQGLSLPVSSMESTTSQDASNTSPQPQSQPSPSAFPVIIPPPTIFPVSPSPTRSSATDVFPDDFESTRHLARVATTVPSVSLQRVDSRRLRLALALIHQHQSRISPVHLRRLMQLWKISSAKSSHPTPLPCPRRRLYLWTPPLSKCGSHRRRRHRRA